MSEFLSPDGDTNFSGHVVMMVDTFPALSETFILDQIDALQARGIRLRIVAGYRNRSGLIQEKGKRLASRAFYAEDQMGPLKQLPRVIRSRLYPLGLQKRIYEAALRDAQLVLCHFGPVGRRAALALEDTPRPLLWTIFHGYDVSSYLRSQRADVYAQLFERGDRFLGVSRFWIDRLRKLGSPQDRTGMLRMGIDLRQFPFTERPPVSNAPLQLLSVCRLVEKKGIEYALRALAKFSRLRPSVQWSYEIIGEGRFGRPLKRLSRKLRIDDRVTFAGRLPAEAVRAKLVASDVFLLPSVTARNGDMEGIPVSLMEAMAAGVPVLSTCHSGIPELIDHGETGLLAPERDVDALASNLCALIDRPQQRSAMIRAARRKIEMDFNQEKIADRLADEIREALARTEEP